MTFDVMSAGADTPALVLIRGARVFNPDDLGQHDVLVGGGRVLAVEEHLSQPADGHLTRTVEAAGLWLLPGLVDAHVHILGGGGDGGPHTRNRDLQLSELTGAGVTTVVGMLGTDTTTRSVSELLSRAHALELEGLSAYCTTGGYPIPTPTFSGSVMRDLVYLDRVIGVGELAIADFRSSHPTTSALAQVVSEGHMGGRLAGKAGTSVIHLGDGKTGLAQVRELVAESDLPLRALLPTHVNRSQRLLDEAIDFARTGGVVDVTATIAPSGGFVQAVDPLDAVLSVLDAGIPIEQVTVSSDAGGNMPLVDASGARRLSSHPMGLLYELVRRAFVDGRQPGAVLSAMTRQPADRFGLPAKGRIAAGCDADLVLVDEGFRLHQVYARGRLMVDENGRAIRGSFENHLHA